MAINGDYHAEEKDLVFEKKPSWVHPKLVNGKNSKQQYRQWYSQPIRTRSATHSAPATTDSSNLESSSSTAVANSASSVVTINSAEDDDGIAGPGPSTLEKAAKKTNLASDLDSAMDIDVSAPASFPTQGGVHAAAKSTTAISATQAGSSLRSNAKILANVPIWAQKAYEKVHAPLWLRKQDKAPQHVPAWARKGTAEEDSPKRLEPKAPENIPSNAPETTDLKGSAADVDYSKEIRMFAQPRYSINVDMSMKPPCALKVDLEPRSYSTKPAPTACSARGNSGNIIGMNYIKARRALHQRDPNRRLGWHTTWTVKPANLADLGNPRSKALAGMQAKLDNPYMCKPRGSSPLAIPAGQNNPYVGNRQERCRVEEDSEDEWSGFSDRSKTSIPEPVGGSTSEEMCTKAVRIPFHSMLFFKLSYADIRAIHS